MKGATMAGYEHITKKFTVGKILKWTEEDVFESGCIPETGCRFSYQMNFEDDTLKGLLAQLKDHFDCSDEDMELNACDEDGRIDVSLLENEMGEKATMDEIAAWKAGHCKLWNAIYSLRVELVIRIKIRV